MYMAFLMRDPSADVTDALKVFVDTLGDDGDPDVTDRFYQVTRDGISTLRAGRGTNNDGDEWEAYTSTAWQSAVGALGPEMWVVEISVELSTEFPSLADPFGVMVQVLFSNEGLANYPSDGVTNSAGTWVRMNNTVCQ
jgi:hypothetical protein